MTHREKILGIGRVFLMRGQPIPADVLAKADALGLSLADFDEPTFTHANLEGDDNYGTEAEETVIHDT